MATQVRSDNPMVNITAPETQQARQAYLTFLYNILRLYLTIAVPVLLTLVNVRLAMTPQILEFEYTRAGFPEDDYGFTTDDRLYYGPFAINYLLNNTDISYLGDLTFPNGRSLYTSSELNHMEDVKVVTQIAFMTLLLGGIFSVIIIAYLFFTKNINARQTLRRGLFDGALLTLSIIGFIVFMALVAWDLFFDAFHGIFFESGTWRFSYSDTLIRLFPEQLWFDIAIFIGGLTSLGAIIILIVVWQWGKKASVSENT